MRSFELMIMFALLGAGAWDLLRSYIPQTYGMARMISLVAVVVLIAFILSNLGWISPK